MNEQEPKLTRQQRRALERKERKNSPPQTRVKTIDKEEFLRWSEVIQRETVRRNIERDEEEIALWKASFASQRSTISESDRTMMKLEEKAKRLIKSNNPTFQFILSEFMRIQNKPNYRLLHDPVSKGTMGASAGKTKDGQDLSLQLFIFDSGIRTIEHPLHLALIFTHEVEHLRDIEEFDRSIAHLPLEERVSLHEARRTDPESYRAMEARANAVEMEALINHIGMTQGIDQYIPLTFVYTASKYVEAGCSPNSEKWLQTTAALEAEGFSSTNH